MNDASLIFVTQESDCNSCVGDCFCLRSQESLLDEVSTTSPKLDY
jgi:hypothetical protein